MISASASLGIFTGLTCVYFLMRYLFVDGYGKSNVMLSYFFTGMYFIIMLGAQFSINLQNAAEHCGEPQLVPTFIYTVVPNVTIFGLIVVLTSIFPGWRAPFSNTFGYVVTYLLGIKGIFNKILPAKSGNKLIQQVCEDSSSFINEITPENFEAFIGRMKQNKLFSPDAGQYIPKLYNLVMIKDSIAKLIWYLLTGCLVISTSFNAVVGMTCSRSPDKMAAAQKQFNEEQAKVVIKKPKQFAVTD
jgi:hypothetical protein